MNQGPQGKTSRCRVCGGSRWWRSRTGWRICQRCYSEPLQALQVLASRVQGARATDGRACEPAIDDQQDHGISWAQGTMGPRKRGEAVSRRRAPESA
jgi:hypothetical protein